MARAGTVGTCTRSLPSQVLRRILGAPLPFAHTPSTDLLIANINGGTPPFEGQRASKHIEVRAGIIAVGDLSSPRNGDLGAPAISQASSSIPRPAGSTGVASRDQVRSHSWA